MSLEFPQQFRKYNFMKIRPVGPEFFHAKERTVGQTDMTKLIVAFRNFANAPNNRVEPAYKDIGLCDTSSIASNILW